MPEPRRTVEGTKAFLLSDLVKHQPRTHTQEEWEDLKEQVANLEREQDKIRGRDGGLATKRDYWFAEIIFHGWRQRAERAEYESKIYCRRRLHWILRLIVRRREWEQTHG